MAKKTNHWGALAAAAGVLAAVGMLMLMVLVMGEVRPAEAAFPGKNGDIAYWGYDGKDYEIFTIDAAGGTPFNVNNNNPKEFYQSYSPDGKKIAYQGSDGSDYEIFTINSDGSSGRVQLTSNARNDLHPSYSPDGTKIAYSGIAFPDETQEIFTINASGGDGRQVTNTALDEQDPSWGNSVE
jgi:Tol biopolymer transport system component